MVALIKTPIPSILIVDDEPLVRELFRLALQSLGYEVSEASDGEQALIMLRRRSYSLMLLDLQMPTMNGKTVLTSVRQMFLHDKMKIAIITADALRATEEVHAIADRVMYKPIDMREFIEYAKKLTAGHTPPSSNPPGSNGNVMPPATNPQTPHHTTNSTGSTSSNPSGSGSKLGKDILGNTPLGGEVVISPSI